MSRCIALLLLLTLVSCRIQVEPTITPTPSVRMTLNTDPFPPVAGQATLVITIHTLEETPIDAARVAVRGDMNHPGMAPVMAETTEGANGEYRMPFEFTMSGDWIMTVTAALPNAQEISQTFDLIVNAP